MTSTAKKRVFISYARTPAELTAARWLAANLRRAEGIDRVFLDEETLVQGNPLRASLVAEIREANAIVCLVSPSWIERDHTTQELADAAEFDPTGEVIRRIAVFREKRTSLVKPAEFSRFTSSIEWLEWTNPYAVLWRVYCAILGQAEGPPAEHTQKGEAIATAPDPPPEPWESEAGDVPPSLDCGRDTEWGYVSGDPVSRHRLIIVGGARGENHGHFIMRMERWLTRPPERSEISVRWDTGTSAEVRPQSGEEYLECFGRSLTPSRRHLDRREMVATLRAKLADGNLIAVHPVIDSFFDDEFLLKYYLEWLPELLEEAKPRMRLKCVQPVAWSGGGLSRMAGRLWRPFAAPLAWLSSGEERLARLFVRSLQATPARPHDIRPVLGVELWRVRRRDLKAFCERKGIEGDHRTAVVKFAKQPTSEQIFAAMDRYLIPLWRDRGEGKAG